MEETEAVRFMLLDGGEPVGDDELSRLYAYPDPHPGPGGGCVVRGNVISSVDGAATAGGTSGGLGGAGDRRLFGLLRELADVIVVGIGTARMENYGGARMTVAQRRRRQVRGQSEVPPIAMVTRSGVVENNLAVLTGSEITPLVLTCAVAAASVRKRLGSAAEVIDCSGADPADVDLAVALARLAGHGLPRVLTEGGPHLLGAFIDSGLLDELCLTCAPLLIGGGEVRLAETDAGRRADAFTRMRREHVITDADGYLYLRYRRV